MISANDGDAGWSLLSSVLSDALMPAFMRDRSSMLALLVFVIHGTVDVAGCTTGE